MDAKIIDKDERGYGIEVTDNNSVDHTISVGFDGEIQGHGQDGYADDPNSRTNDENEHVNQARRYANTTSTVNGTMTPSTTPRTPSTSTPSGRR